MTVLNLYALNSIATFFIYLWQRFRELEGETDKFTVRLILFYIPLSIANRISRHRLIKYTEDVNNTISTFDQNFICGTLHTIITELTMVLSAREH